MTSPSRSDDQTIDSIHVIITPENVRFDYRLAGPFPRLAALLIDYLLIMVIVIALAALLGLLVGEASTGPLLIAFFVLQWGYAGFLETYWNGQTPGKKAMALRVVTSSGLPINASQAFLRSFVRTADLILWGVAGLLSMTFSPTFQRLGDRAAGTIVVVERRTGQIRSVQAAGVEKLSTDIIPSSFKADRELIEGLTLYMSRREKLPPALRKSIAKRLAGHFIRIWSLPAKTDPDELLCLLFARCVDDAAVKSKKKPAKPSRSDSSKAREVLA